MHVRAHFPLDQYNGDDHTAILQAINEALKYTNYQTVEEYALCEFIPMRCSGLECMAKGITMENAFIRRAFANLTYKNVMQIHFTDVATMEEVFAAFDLCAQKDLL
jgi:hypothetical protein